MGRFVTYTCGNTLTHSCTHIHTQIYAHTHAHVEHTHTHTHTYMQANMHPLTCACTQTNLHTLIKLPPYGAKFREAQYLQNDIILNLWKQIKSSNYVGTFTS